MQPHFHIRQLFAQHPNQAPHRLRIGPAHGIGEIELLQVNAAFRADAMRPKQFLHRPFGRNLAFIIAAKGRHHQGAFHRDAGLGVEIKPAHHTFPHFRRRAVIIALGEGIGCVKADLADQINALGRARTIETLFIQPERFIAHAWAFLDGGEKLRRIHHLRHGLGRDEGRHLNGGEPGLSQCFHQRHAIRQRIDHGFNLKPLTRAFFVEMDMLWQIRHGGASLLAGVDSAARRDDACA